MSSSEMDTIIDNINKRYVSYSTITIINKTKKKYVIL